METVIVELKHEKAMQLLQDLEAMEIIQMHKVEPTNGLTLLQKFRGILSKDDFNDLNQHIKEIREEWNNS